MVNETWPSQSSVDLGKVAVQILSTPMPSHLKMPLNCIAPGGDGVKAYVLYEVEKGHEEEGYKEILRLAPFLSIEGFKCTVEPVLPAEEALPLVGLKL